MVSLLRGQSSPGEGGMTIFGHLAELRMRLVRMLLAVAIGSIVILVFYDQFLQFLTQPYRNICNTRPDFKCDGTLFTLGPIEGLSARMRIAGYGIDHCLACHRVAVVEVHRSRTEQARKEILDSIHRYFGDPVYDWCMARILDAGQSS